MSKDTILKSDARDKQLIQIALDNFDSVINIMADQRMQDHEVLMVLSYNIKLMTHTFLEVVSNYDKGSMDKLMDEFEKMVIGEMEKGRWKHEENKERKEMNNVLR